MNQGISIVLTRREKFYLHKQNEKNFTKNLLLFSIYLFVKTAVNVSMNKQKRNTFLSISITNTNIKAIFVINNEHFKINGNKKPICFSTIQQVFGAYG